MQRIVIDTNVIVSALIQKSYPFFILDEGLVNPNIQFCLSDLVLKEYHEVLHREKFARFPDFVENARFILGLLNSIALKFYPKQKADILSDKDDNKFLELSRASKAHFLITGNHRDFSIRQFSGTQIVNQREFYREHMLR